ncbi:MAG: hypothetical protein WC792_00295 [Candidatus Micrarchaeia archaeon]|jgi:mevalonate kinase
MRKIAAAEAPTKIIFSGEHGVVHGAPGIALALEPCNKVELYEEAGKPGLVVESERGKVFVSPEGAVEGTAQEKKTFEPFVAVVDYLRQTEGFFPKTRLVAKIISAKAPKGVGNSASIAAALALVLFASMGRRPRMGKTPEDDELWMCAQAAEEKAHGGRPSGIDAMAVCRGNTELIRTVEGGKVKWNFTARPKLSLPKGTALLIVDTYKNGERANTGEMVLQVAKSLGLTKIDLATGKEVVKPLAEFSREDKHKAGAFAEVFEKIVSQLKPSGNAKLLGKAMDENHALLKKLGASTPEIEKAVETARHACALGAKLTGAGGKGGAVLVLVESSKKKQVEDPISRAGFSIFEARPAGHGARLVG